METELIDALVLLDATDAIAGLCVSEGNYQLLSSPLQFTPCDESDFIQVTRNTEEDADQANVVVTSQSDSKSDACQCLCQQTYAVFYSNGTSVDDSRNEEYGVFPVQGTYTEDSSNAVFIDDESNSLNWRWTPVNEEEPGSEFQRQNRSPNQK